jgi:nicotinamidase-related amidase
MSDQAPALHPERTALLVMDFQQGVLQRMQGLEPLIGRVRGAIADMRDHGGTMSTTDLDRQLRDRGIDTLVLAGISTSGVVLSTLIEAADRDYRLYVLSDGTEDPDEQARDVLLGRIFPRRAQVIDTATLRGLLSP